MTEARCLVVDTLRCSETSFPKLTTLSFCLLKTGSTLKAFLWEKNGDSISVILQVLQQTVLLSRHFWTILLYSTAVSWNVSELYLPFLTILATVETEIFFLCASLVFFWHGSFSGAFLMPSWHKTLRSSRSTLRLSNVVMPDEQSFCWRAAALKSQFPWSVKE